MANLLSLDEARSALVIDKLNLDEHLEQQPQLNSDISDAYEDAVRRRDTLKHDMEIAHAELDEQLRKAAVEAGEKLTEAALKQKITLIPRMRKLEKQMIDLNLEVGQWAGRRDSSRQRNDAMKAMSQLFASNYFARDYAKVREDREQQDARDRAAIKEAQERKKNQEGSIERKRRS